MHPRFLLLAAPLAMGASAAHAAEDEPVFDERYLVDDGHIPFPLPRKTTASFAIRGEYQLRFRAMNDLPLTPPIGAPPGVGETLGQNAYLYHWLRVRPVFNYRDVLKIYGELDFPRGLVAGDTTEFASAARDDFADRQWYEVHPRQLYFQVTTPIGLFRVGQQTSMWGMGLVAHDGDQPSLFGDVRRGSLVERLLFATKPLGVDGPLAIALAGDVVFEDARARLIDGDRAFQGVLAVRWQTPRYELGIYGVVRHQEADQQAVDELTPFIEELTVGVVDVAAKFNLPIPATPAFLWGQAEAAFIGGTTNFLRNIDLLAAGEDEAIASFGAAARLGVVTMAQNDAKQRWGDIALTVEYGWASGDADPYDGTTRRFTFDQNHNVGLVLFDHVLAWKTARSATIAQDPSIVNRPSPGLQFLPSEGAVFGAQYLNPTIVIRPKHWLDLKAGLVIAESTAEVVDPFQAGALGNYANYDGGDERRRDLGIELDAGLDFRVPVHESLVINTGAEGGVLFPGSAFDDETGTPLPTQYLLNTKLGLNF